MLKKLQVSESVWLYFARCENKLQAMIPVVLVSYSFLCNFQLVMYPEVSVPVLQGKAVFYSDLEPDSSSKVLESNKMMLPSETVFVLCI